jgi:hypothetical protein
MSTLSSVMLLHKVTHASRASSPLWRRTEHIPLLRLCRLTLGSPSQKRLTRGAGGLVGALKATPVVRAGLYPSAVALQKPVHLVR